MHGASCSVLGAAFGGNHPSISPHRLRLDPADAPQRRNKQRAVLKRLNSLCHCGAIWLRKRIRCQMCGRPVGLHSAVCGQTNPARSAALSQPVSSAARAERRRQKEAVKKRLLLRE
ncbi:hypothetical protein MHYP_G00220000 [Metynnis hypsauchen]